MYDAAHSTVSIIFFLNIYLFLTKQVYKKATWAALRIIFLLEILACGRFQFQ